MYLSRCGDRVRDILACLFYKPSLERPLYFYLVFRSYWQHDNNQQLFCFVLFKAFPVYILNYAKIHWNPTNTWSWKMQKSFALKCNFIFSFKLLSILYIRTSKTGLIFWDDPWPACGDFNILCPTNYFVSFGWNDL